MGTWGPGIFENDDACDVRDTYREKLIIGESDSEAEAAIIREFGDDPEQRFWVPLALTQWKLGRLNAHSKSKALSIIAQELSTLYEQWSPDLMKKREAELVRTKETICAEMLSPKKLRMPAWAWKCPWSIGSVLQYKVLFPTMDNPLYEQYVLLLILNISETPAGEIPCEVISVGLYDWHSKKSMKSGIGNIPAQSLSLIDFVTKSGSSKSHHSILLSSSLIREHEVTCISKEPLSFSLPKPTPINAPMNSTFDKMISRTLNQGIRG